MQSLRNQGKYLISSLSEHASHGINTHGNAKGLVPLISPLIPTRTRKRIRNRKPFGSETLEKITQRS